MTDRTPPEQRAFILGFRAGARIGAEYEMPCDDIADIMLEALEDNTTPQDDQPEYPTRLVKVCGDLVAAHISNNSRGIADAIDEIGDLI